MNVWRNFGILILFTIAFIGLAAWFAELFEWSGDTNRVVEYKPTFRTLFDAVRVSRDEEEKPVEIDHEVIPSPADTARRKSSANLKDLAYGKSTFSWHDVKYSIPYRDGSRTLLNNVSGYCTPGTMTALVGSSGAGKTTRTFYLLPNGKC